MCEWNEDSRTPGSWKVIINHLLKSDFYWKFEYQIRVDFFLCPFNFTSIKRYCKEISSHLVSSLPWNIKLLCAMAIWANKIVYRDNVRSVKKRHDIRIRRVDFELDLISFFRFMFWSECFVCLESIWLWIWRFQEGRLMVSYALYDVILTFLDKQCYCNVSNARQ